MGQHALGGACQEVHAGVWSSTHLLASMNTSALGKCPVVRTVLRALARTRQLMQGMPAQTAMPWWVMLAYSHSNVFGRAGSQVGTEPRAELELLEKSWEAAVPPVPCVLVRHPCPVFSWVGLSLVGLSSFSWDQQCLSVTHLTSWLGAFLTIALSESRFQLADAII